MKAFFSNVWTKRFVSVIPVFYTVAVCYLCYYSIFYDIHVENTSSLCVVVSAVSLIALILLLYTRNQLLTKISSFVILTAMLPVVLLYFEVKVLFIPIVIVGIVILLLSGAGEGKKTLFGTLILLMYIFGALGYYLFTSFFVTHAKTDVIASGFSTSGMYRYRIVNTEDTSGGSTAVYIEPNYADVTYPFVTLTLKNMEHICYQERPMCENIDLEWKTESRTDITDRLNKLSQNIEVTFTDEELDDFGVTVDSRLQLDAISVYELMAIGKTASDVDPLVLDELTDEQLEHFDIGRDPTGKYYVLDPTSDFYAAIEKPEGERVFLSDLNKKGYKAFNKMHLDDYGYTLFEIEKNNNIMLSSLTDEQLEKIGISPEGDVLVFNGKICFSYYVAELEKYFDTESRKLSIDLLS